MLDMADLNIAEDFNQRRSFIRKEIKRTNKIMEKVIGKFGILNEPGHTIYYTSRKHAYIILTPLNPTFI